MRKHIYKIAALMLMAVMLMPSAALAAAHDAVQDVSSDTATIYIGKILTASQSGKFPNISDFNFKLTAVKAWENANQDTALSGKDIPVSEMPMPASSSADHHKVTVEGQTATVTAGDFKGQANTSRNDTGTEKFRVTPVNIKFTKAGYYMYKVTETGSTPASVPGVTYDENSYYVVVYVCNNTDENGNTTDGVYVHDITSYRNAPGSDTQPDLSDIQNKTDNGGQAASENNHENMGKTGKSSPEPGTDDDTGLPEGPDKLEAYKFFNDHITHDVVITNNVTGNLGDRTKEFEITVTLSGLEKGVTYTTDIAAADKTDKNLTTEGTDLVSASAGSVDPGSKTFTADQEGKAEFLIRLADDEVLVMNALPATAKYKAEEHPSDHIASYTVTSTSGEAVIASPEAANTGDQMALATGEETVDAKKDGTVTIAFVNHRNLATITGLPYYGDYVYVLTALAVVCAVLWLIANIRKRTEE